MSEGGMGGVPDPAAAVATTALSGGAVAVLPATAGNTLLHVFNIVAIVALCAVLALFVTAQIIKHINK